MPASSPDPNPLARNALLVSLIPFVSALSLLALRVGIGPKTLLFWVAQVGGIALFGFLVVGSGLSIVALSRSQGRRDWRIFTSFGFLALAIAGVVAFAATA